MPVQGVRKMPTSSLNFKASGPESHLGHGNPADAVRLESCHVCHSCVVLMPFLVSEQKSL